MILQVLGLSRDTAFHAIFTLHETGIFNIQESRKMTCTLRERCDWSVTPRYSRNCRVKYFFRSLGGGIIALSTREVRLTAIPRQSCKERKKDDGRECKTKAQEKRIKRNYEGFPLKNFPGKSQRSRPVSKRDTRRGPAIDDRAESVDRLPLRALSACSVRWTSAKFHVNCSPAHAILYRASACERT